MAAGVHIFDRTQDQLLPLRINVVKKSSCQPLVIETQNSNLFDFYTFLFVLWGEGAIYGSYHYQPRDNLVFKEGGYHSMIKTWQCVRVSVYMADIFADIKWKNFQCKGQVSQEDILASSHWSFCQNSIVDVQFESRRGLFMIIATIVVKFKSIVRTLKYFKGWTFSNADPLSAIVVFSPIDYFSWLFRGGLMISIRSIILKLNQTRLHFCISL